MEAIFVSSMRPYLLKYKISYDILIIIRLRM